MDEPSWMVRRNYRYSKKGRASALPFFWKQPSYFFSSAFFLPSPCFLGSAFFLPSPFFCSFLASSFLSAAKATGAKVAAANTAASRVVNNLLMIFLSVVERWVGCTTEYRSTSLTTERRQRLTSATGEN